MSRQDKAKVRMKNTLFFLIFAFSLLAFPFTIAALQGWREIKGRSFPASDFPQRAVPNSVS
jgi:hypothetical protein